MFDIWSFLLQTLTISGVAALILLIKALFKDKLPPKWQFAVWSVLGLMMLIPAGLFGRYALFRWQIPIEIIKSCWVFGKMVARACNSGLYRYDNHLSDCRHTFDERKIARSYLPWLA